jgi:OmpA family
MAFVSSRRGEHASKGASASYVAAAAAFAAIVAIAGAGCASPKFPLCDNDDHCNADGHKGVCVNHTCVDCRNDAACGSGKSCVAGACTPVAGFCDEKTLCPSGQPCDGNRCQPPKPVAGPVECDDEHVCKGAGQRCENNHCVSPPRGGPGCTDFPAPKFEFESPELRSDVRTVLERLAKCISSGSLKGARVLLTGHCDARGEGEFNMGLGAQRAETVRVFLVGLGVPAASINTSSRGKLDAAGTDDASMVNDRRVDIEVQ